MLPSLDKEMYFLFWQTCIKNPQVPRHGDIILIIIFSLVYTSSILQELQTVIDAMVIVQVMSRPWRKYQTANVKKNMFRCNTVHLVIGQYNKMYLKQTTWEH